MSAGVTPPATGRQRAYRATAAVWRWFANLCGIALIAGGIGFAIVHAIAGNNDVITASDQRVMRDGQRVLAAGLKPPVVTVRMQEPIVYFFDMVRHEACPGEVLRTWSSADPHDPEHVLPNDPAVITSRRPISEFRVMAYDDIKSVVEQPASVSPGVWILEVGVQSRCPTRTRYDRIVKLVVEVAP